MYQQPSTSKSQQWQSREKETAGNEKRLLQGNLGKKLQLITNYYRVRLAQRDRTIKPCLIHVYTLQLSSKGIIKKGKAICQELFWSAVRQFPDIFGDYRHLIYDNTATLYCAYPIWDFDKKEVVRKGAELEWEFNHSPAGHGREILAYISIKKLDEFVLEQQANVPLTNQQLQFLQAMYSQCVRCPMFGHSENWFTETTKIYRIPFDDAYAPIELGDCMAVLRSLKCAFKMDSQGLPLFNSDLAHSVFAKVNLELIDFYAFIYDTTLTKRDRELLTDYTMNQQQVDRLDTALRGLMLKAKYSAFHPKYVRLVPPDQPRFEEPEMGEYASGAGASSFQNIFIPMEQLTISDRVQKIRKRLRPETLAKMVKETAYIPPERFKMIRELVEDSQLCNNPFADSFEVSIDREMVRLEGRQLPKPVMFGANSRRGLVKALDKTLVLAVICLNISEYFGLNSAITNWINCCKEESIKFVSGPPFGVFNYALKRIGGQYVEERYDIPHFNKFLDSVKQQAAEYHPNAEPLFVFVVDDKNPDYIYDSIKTRCELELGIMSQVVKIGTLKRMERGNNKPAGVGDPATLNNMLLKINCKLEGVNNRVMDCHGWDKFTNKKAPTLFLGVDAIHPSRDEDMPSMAAVTANLDVEICGWFRGFFLEKDGQREIHQLSAMFESALDTFYTANQKAPSHIVVLRDGVSDSEISYLSQMELGQLGNACRGFKEYYKQPNYRPTISYLVVQKKHGTRFWMPQTEQQGSRYTSDRFRPNGNVPSGTVVDTVITGWTVQGTSRPAHYTMVEPLQWDTWRLTADEWQSCMYGLCHLVGRSKAVVSTPAPVYYADLLCTRARRYVHTYRRENQEDFDTIVIQKGWKAQQWQSREKETAGNEKRLLQGNLGKKLQLITNYYRVCLAQRDRTIKPCLIHVYTLQVSSKGIIKKESKAICQELFWSAVRQFSDIFRDYRHLIYDNAATLYCAYPIWDFDKKEVSPAGENHQFLVHISLTKVYEFTLEQQSNVPLTSQQLQFLQSMYSQCVRCPMFGQAENWFTETTKIYRIPSAGTYDPIVLEHCMEVLRALKCAFKMDSQGLPLFNSDLAHSVFAKVNLELIDFTHFFTTLDNALRGLMLKDKYSAYHPKYVRLVPPDQPRFEKPEMGEVSVQEYIQRRYNIHLRYPSMPLVQVHPASKNIFIPMELLTISDRVQKIRKRLRPETLAKMVKGTAYIPPERFRMIRELVEDSQLCNNPFADSFGVSIDREMVRLEAITNWINCCKEESIKFVSGVPFGVFNYALKRIGGQYVEERYDIPHFNKFLDSVKQQAAEYHPNAEPLFVFVVDDKNQDYIYDSIKTRCELELGIMSQVVKIGTLKRMERGNNKPAGVGDPATLNNMLLKINCKLEGVNSRVMGCHGWDKFTDKNAPTLFLGVDAIHPSRDEDMPSMAAVTANLDVESALDTFYRANDKAPSHIVVLRDGVSDSEISYLSQMELGQLGNACRGFKEYYKLSNYRPTISYLVVQKKHGTRFWMPQTEQQGSRYTSDRFRPNGNVPSGTVVDTVITVQGTSRPAHYTMVEPLQWDTWRLTADEWQSCMYGLCHLVGRSKAVVSTPAPVYYADLLCTRARRYVHTYRRENREDFDTIVIQKRLESSMYWT
uniref:Uncharacterized protein n=1 Tax=Ditylenchus dipsaci TaxID=166011 RepID=A0A915D123_9BILA